MPHPAAFRQSRRIGADCEGHRTVAAACCVGRVFLSAADPDLDGAMKAVAAERDSDRLSRHNTQMRLRAIREIGKEGKHAQDMKEPPLHETALM